MKLVKFLAVLIMAMMVFPTVSFAEETSAGATSSDTDQTVRVGYYENEVFQEGATPGAVKNGYAYEYYRKLSEYTGWNYEYV